MKLASRVSLFTRVRAPAYTAEAAFVNQAKWATKRATKLGEFEKPGCAFFW
jgi:hypothetical protein